MLAEKIIDDIRDASSRLEPEHSVLIVDDEASIRKTLEGVFSDEGFSTLVAEDGQQALVLLKSFKPSVVLLDIWMPGMDGLEILLKIKQMYPSVPVIMMSGHATIATAVKATRLGAFDFIEKPLGLGATLALVRRALRGVPETEGHGDTVSFTPQEQGEFVVGRDWDPATLKPLAFKSHAWKGRKVVQRTLSGNAILYGQGLHSGRKSGLILEPLPSNSGIHFVGVSESTVVPAHVDYVASTGFATTVRLGDTQAGTIEHLMSALHAYGISNLLIKCNGEVPVMDGSAREFCALIDQTGTVEQSGDWYEIKIQEVLRVGNDKEFIQFEPHDCFEVDYTLEYPAPLGKQHFVFSLNDIEDYKREIAPARTFGFVKDIGALQKQGLALGGRFDNFVLIGAEGPINGAMRFSEEPVRHKILDAIGDLYLLGRRIQGRVRAVMTGHSDNFALLKMLHARLCEQAS